MKTAKLSHARIADEMTDELTEEQKEKKLKKIELLRLKKLQRDELPHLYGMKLYRWQRQWLESTNTMNLMSKANQIGGSSIQIIKCIHWATDPVVRKEVFGKTMDEPLVFLYFMPALNLFAREFHSRWIKQFMPRGSHKESGLYSWRAEYDRKKLSDIKLIEFPEANCIIHTLGYGSDVHKSMQAMTPDAIFADEEMPQHIWPEIWARLSSKFAQRRGFFHMTCTLTRGEQMWMEAFEGKSDAFKQALIMSVSMYDCLQKEDGSKGHHTIESIEQFAKALPDQRSKEVRVFGRFARADGLLIQTFKEESHVNENPEPLPKDWMVFSGIDIGGGGKSHPGAITFVGVNPDYTRARVLKVWRGNSRQDTTAGDILEKYIEMRKAYGLQLAAEYYDHAAKDFKVLAHRAYVPVQSADKKQQHGVDLIQTLFRYNALTIDRTEDGDESKLIKELNSLTYDSFFGSGSELPDDAFDSLRYALSKVPMRLDQVKVLADVKVESSTPARLTERELRPEPDIIDEYQSEIELFNAVSEEY